MAGMQGQWRGKRWAALLGALWMGLAQAPSASAACGWRQSNGDVTSPAGGPIVLNSLGLTLIANKHWYEDGRFPVGALMGTDETRFSSYGGCTNLRELAGSRLELVYVPPAGAVPQGQGYRLKPNALGVAVDIQFATGTAHPAGLALAQSTGIVGAGGVLGNLGLSPVPLRITLVKTGAFASDGAQSLLSMPGDLGWLRYYRAGNANVVAVSDNVLRLPSGYGANQQDYMGRALAPHCRLTRLGDLTPAGNTVIRLAAVSQRDFLGPGAIDRGTRTQRVGFACEGSDHLKPVLYVEATYPFNNGVNGVGMPERDSDVGVQLLLDDQPLPLGTPSSALGWNPVALGSSLADGQGGFVSAQGRYCLGNCGDDMSGAAWVNGGAASGDNLGREPRLTLRYYQTTRQTPAPRTFSVPFTLSLDVQ